MDKIGETI
nr:unnamed protein product [Callosobruchus chinensis]